MVHGTKLSAAGQEPTTTNGRIRSRPNLPFGERVYGSRRPISAIRPSPENERLYQPVDPTDPEIIALAKSIREIGVQEPLVITKDNWIVSGHRRHAAAKLIGQKTVRVRVLEFRRVDKPNRFLKLLREYNRQRIKTNAEKLREEIVSVNPDDAYTALTAHRVGQETLNADTIEINGRKRRADISTAKLPMLNAVIAILNDQRKFRPLSDRRIHYAMLNDPPLKHASKPHSTYANDLKSYKALVDLLTRARLDGSIPFDAIADETRPVTVWNVHQDVQPYLRQELDGFLKGYWRDLLQSQPNHLEIMVEKNTVAPIIRPVASEYCIPMTSGRGFCSLPPRHDMAKRFRASGKGRLVLLMLSDLDPDGEEIAHSFARSMRDDFKIRKLDAIKVAITGDQVVDYELSAKMTAKETSTNYSKFTERHGDDVFELEALTPETLQSLLRDAIDSVIDTDAFNQEIDAEKEGAAFLEGVRANMQAHFAEIMDNGAEA